jgi:hypothetical protein
VFWVLLDGKSASYLVTLTAVGDTTLQHDTLAVFPYKPSGSLGDPLGGLTGFDFILPDSLFAASWYDSVGPRTVVVDVDPDGSVDTLYDGVGSMGGFSHDGRRILMTGWQGPNGYKAPNTVIDFDLDKLVASYPVCANHPLSVAPPNEADMPLFFVMSAPNPIGVNAWAFDEQRGYIKLTDVQLPMQVQHMSVTDNTLHYEASNLSQTDSTTVCELNLDSLLSKRKWLEEPPEGFLEPPCSRYLTDPKYKPKPPPKPEIQTTATVDSCYEYFFEIDTLPLDERPLTPLATGLPECATWGTDDEGVVVLIKDGEHFYHPSEIARRGLMLVDRFRSRQDSADLQLIHRYTERLHLQSIQSNGALFYPFHFDYHVDEEEEGFMEAPWCSGKAQGEILSFLVRTFIITGDSLYLDRASFTFYSFVSEPGDAEYWVSYTDDAGCFWSEEYPMLQPAMTLNGLVGALYGVYEYYLVSNNGWAFEIMQRLLRTIRNYLPSFRCVDGPSYSGLRFRQQSAESHKAHIEQLEQLYRITDDKYFLWQADSLRSDWPQPEDSR